MAANAKYEKLRKKLIEVTGNRVRRSWNRRKLSKPCRLSNNAKKNDEIGKFLADAAQVFHRHHPAGCYGLAANQFGYNVRVFAMRRPNRNSFMYFINPIILKKDRPQSKVEHCLSHPGEAMNVCRYKNITVDSDNHGVMKFSGIEAQIFQHEMDHLEGVLI